MTANAHPDDRVWSWSRLSMLMVAVFALQIVLVFWMSEPARATSPVKKGDITFRVVAVPLQQEDLFDNLLSTDPTMFVLPAEDTFSGKAWLKRKPITYDPPDWDEPPRWLPLNQEQLGGTFLKFVETNSGATVQLA